MFDAYGTLFDVHSVVRQAGHALRGDLGALSLLWRRKQIESTWRRALMNRYEDFWRVTESALRSAAVELNIEIADSQVQAFMHSYLSPALLPDTVAALDALGAFPLAILSNGTPAMLDAALRSHGLESRFAHVLSVDALRTYKPSPAVYALAVDAWKIPAPDILFVSSNAWDAAGAKAFGYRVCWCNRAGEPADHLGFAPDFTVDRLDRIAGCL